MLDNLDIWQFEAYHRRIMRMKIKETKAQELAFAHAQAGMGGVRFRGINKSNEFWNIPELTSKKDAKKVNQISSDQVLQLTKMIR